MDYEKLYKESLERAKIWQDHLNECGDKDYADELNYIFPELAESEDERIRKDLIQWINEFPDTIWRGHYKKDVVTWLEKQDGVAKLNEEEQNKFAKGVLTSCALSFINYLDAHKYEGKMCVSNGECEDIENAFHNAMWDRLHRYYCKYIEKQGVQRPINDIDEDIVEAVKDTSILDMVEPKFKVGDWIMDKESKEVFYISKNLANTYKIVDIEGNDYHVPHYILEEDYDVWTIQDAKPGDVLADKYNNIGIFQECKGICWHSYIYLGCDGELRGFNIGGSHEQTGTHPATKEQREQLEKAMADAGYEWDAEKKELKHDENE